MATGPAKAVEPNDWQAVEPNDWQTVPENRPQATVRATPPLLSYPGIKSRGSYLARDKAVNGPSCHWWSSGSALSAGRLDLNPVPGAIIPATAWCGGGRWIG